MDDARIWITDDQPTDASKLAGQRPYAPGNRRATQAWLVPADLVPRLPCHGGHRTELGTGRALRRRQHRDPYVGKVWVAPGQFDDVQQLRWTFD